jgi:hypothetical protein
VLEGVAYKTENINLSIDVEALNKKVIAAT